MPDRDPLKQKPEMTGGVDPWEDAGTKKGKVDQGSSVGMGIDESLSAIPDGAHEAVPPPPPDLVVFQPKRSPIAQGLKCKFEVEIGLPPGMPTAASALAEQFIRAGLGAVQEEMLRSYGESLQVLKVELVAEPTPINWTWAVRSKG